MGIALGLVTWFQLWPADGCSPFTNSGQAKSCQQGLGDAKEGGLLSAGMHVEDHQRPCIKPVCMTRTEGAEGATHAGTLERSKG